MRDRIWPSAATRQVEVRKSNVPVAQRREQRPNIQDIHCSCHTAACGGDTPKPGARIARRRATARPHTQPVLRTMGSSSR